MAEEVLWETSLIGLAIFLFEQLSFLPSGQSIFVVGQAPAVTTAINQSRNSRSQKILLILLILRMNDLSIDILLPFVV